MVVIIKQKTVSVYSYTKENDCSKYFIFDSLLLNTDFFSCFDNLLLNFKRDFQTIGCYTSVYISEFYTIFY